MRAPKFALGFVALAGLAGCPRAQKEPPPPAESLEVSSAAPGALGALAAGTDAAPPIVVLRRQPDDPFGLGQDPQEPQEPEEPEAQPDAGPQSEAPENVPL